MLDAVGRQFRGEHLKSSASRGVRALFAGHKATINIFPYMLPHMGLAGLAYGLAVDPIYSCKVAGYLWFAVAFLDMLFPLNHYSAADLCRERARLVTLCSLLPGLTVPLFVLLILSGLYIIQQSTVSFGDLILITTTTGFTAAILTIPAAHELIHQRHPLARALGTLAMICFGYGNFCIEHIHGHHRKVATSKDPATARLGESFYNFYLRVFSSSIVDAWKIEERRVRKKGKIISMIYNRALHNLLIQMIFYIVIGISLGWYILFFIVAIGIIGLSTLEAINYIQHYGLVRREIEYGKFEAVSPAHAWTSGHPISNWLLFNLPRHSDHHCNPNKRFFELSCAFESPKLPFGYFCLFWLVLVPPLWMNVMNYRILSLQR